MYKKTIVNSLITLALNTVGVLLIIFSPFREKTSFAVAYSFFLVAISFTIYRFFYFILNKENRVISILLIQNIWKTKSVSNGIKEVLLNNILALEKIPNHLEIIDYGMELFWKSFAWFIGILAAYITMVYFVIKPILLNVFL